jgi:hypothetical protein
VKVYQFIVTIVVAVEPPYVAVMVTLFPEEPALLEAVNLPTPAPAGTVINDGTGSEPGSLLVSCTVALFPAGTLVPRVTEMVV